MSELHILNGDFALPLWKECCFPAESLVWKETYLEGPLPQTENLPVFRSARAGYLSTFEELSDIDSVALYRHLQKMEDTLLALSENDVLMLWFDACIFDQTILMRILYLLNRKQKGSPRIYLYCCQSNCLVMEDFRRGNAEKIALDENDLKASAKAWEAFSCGDAEKMIHLAQQEDLAHLPEMRKALLRCADEVPDENGLTRTQRQILQIVSKESCSFETVFMRLDAFEEYPFLGDTACQRILKDLVGKGLLEFVRNGHYRLTSAGRWLITTEE